MNLGGVSNKAITFVWDIVEAVEVKEFRAFQ